MNLFAWTPTLSLALILLPSSWSGENSPGKPSSLFPGPYWSGLAGFALELEAEELELRDELIAAQIKYLSALEEAVAGVGELGPDHPARPLAWARIEYLLETSFRLLGDTGEYEKFLAASEGLRPLPAPEPAEEAPPPGSGGDDPGMPGAGLVFRDGEGNRLLPALIDRDWVLVDAATSRPAADGREIVAIPGTSAGEAGIDGFPLVRGRAAWLRAAALERIGRAKEAAAEISRLGVIRDWLILGPLDGETEAAFSGLPKNPDWLAPSAFHPGQHDPVAWRPFASRDPLGRLLPGALFRSPGARAVRALALVYSPLDAGAVLRFGSGSAVDIGVNNGFSRRERHGGAPDPDQDAVDVWLKKGWNLVFVRLFSSPGDWGFAARLTTPEGDPLRLETANPESPEPFLAEAANALRGPAWEGYYRPPAASGAGGVPVLLDRVSANPGDARAAFYLAFLLAARQAAGGQERFSRELLFRQAIDASGGHPFFILTAARHVDSGLDGPEREENLRLVLLREAADRGSSAALADLGRLYLEVMRQPRRAAGYAGAALAANPISLRAGLLEYDVAVRRDWRPVADQLLRRLTRVHPAAAPARLRLGRLWLAGGRPRQALAEFHAVLAVDAANPEALAGAVASLGLLGQISAAVELLSGHLDRFPYDYDARLKLVDIYRSAGRDAEARRTLDEALLLSSDDPRALSRLGEMEHETLAAGYGAGGEPEPRIVRQELDPSPPLRRPPDDWEYLYFQIEDRLGNEGYMDRNVSFAIKIHSERAARNIRHLGLWLDPGLRKGVITRFEVVDGNRREAFTLPAASGPEDGPLEFHLPPLRRDAIVEAEISIPRDRPRILGDYFEQIVPLAQAAPVRLSRYLFTAPREARVFFHPLNGAPEAMVVTSRDGRRITHVWEINHPPAFAREADSPSRYGSVPCVQISSFADWNDFARWYWRFVGRQEAPPPELRRLADLAAAGGDGTPLNRLKLAAGWMARQIAHRDWASSLYAFRPLSARSILARMSADGKDRTLLLCLLAREYGLEAWPVLARLRDRSFAPGAASPVPRPLLDHFNHSLVMLDSGDGQSLLMDASNPYRPPEVLPSQLSGSLGLAVFPDSARILTLPDLGSAACEWRETSELTVDENGDASWRENILGAGTAAEILRFRFQNPETRARAWEAFLALQAGQPFEAAADFRDAPHSPDTAFFSGRSEFRRAATIQENRAILPVPGLPGPAAPGGGNQGFPLSLDDLSRRGRREQDLLLPHGFRISREIRIRHPEEWRPANPEPPFRREYAFGTISRTAEYSPGSLLIGLDLEVPVHLVAAGDYPDFREMAAFAKRWLNPVLVWETP